MKVNNFSFILSVTSDGSERHNLNTFFLTGKKIQ